jgi:Arc/MetJ family transcription regulator
MQKKIEIEIDDDLVEQVIRRYGLHGAREAVHLALRTLLGEDDDANGEQQDDEYDELSDLSAWEPRRSGDTG